MRQAGSSRHRFIYTALLGSAALLEAVPFAPASAAVVVIAGNPTSISINDNTTASPYPSAATVAAGTAPTVTKARVLLSGFAHDRPLDVDMMLVGPNGRSAMLMSDAGGSAAVSGLTLTFSPTATADIPIGSIGSGTYRPRNYDYADLDVFPSFAPSGLLNAPADLSTFNLFDGEGTWNLYIVDDSPSFSGSISGGWLLLLTVPATFTVNSTADDGNGVCNGTKCTLRDAVAAAGNGDLIQFSSLFHTPQTIALTGGEIVVGGSRELTIQGPGADKLDISGNFSSRIFRVLGGAALSVYGVTMRDGVAGDVGGAIVSDGSIDLHDCVVAGNRAGPTFNGGGVYVAGNFGNFYGTTIRDNRAAFGAGIEVINAGARFVDSTVSTNAASSGGGGIDFNTVPSGATQTLDLIDSTIAFNRSPGIGGVRVASATGVSATANLANTLIANQSGASVGTAGADASIVSQGFNLASDSGGGFLTQASDQTSTDPRLGPLMRGGGTTPTHALLGGSPALNTGLSNSVELDQRGQSRRFGGAAASGGDGADIGAVEMRSQVVTSLAATGAGTLYQAITQANVVGGLWDIVFDGPQFDGQRTLPIVTALPAITTSLTINGAGAERLTLARGGAIDFSIFTDTTAGTSLSISGMTISNGQDVGAGGGQDGFGGGIDVRHADLYLAEVHVTGNHATYCGGAALRDGNGEITRSTFSANTADNLGGALCMQATSISRRLRIDASTIAANVAIAAGVGGGGAILVSSSSSGVAAALQIRDDTIAENVASHGAGIYAEASSGALVPVTLRNSILANGNNLDVQGLLASAAYLSNGYNLADDGAAGVLAGFADQPSTNAQLAPLALYGGHTPGYLLQATSPARQAGLYSGASADQRGIERPILSDTNVIDIGAIESEVLFRGTFQ